MSFDMLVVIRSSRSISEKILEMEAVLFEPNTVVQLPDADIFVMPTSRNYR